jgi:hypothetical protein
MTITPARRADQREQRKPRRLRRARPTTRRRLPYSRDFPRLKQLGQSAAQSATADAPAAVGVPTKRKECTPSVGRVGDLGQRSDSRTRDFGSATRSWRRRRRLPVETRPGLDHRPAARRDPGVLFPAGGFGIVEHLGTTLPGPGYKDWQALLMPIALPRCGAQGFSAAAGATRSPTLRAPT